jgi:hypothetical protein
MMFKKKGLIFCPNGQNGYDQHSFMVPTPILMGDKIRVFGAVRDASGVARICSIDLNAQNPSEIIPNSYRLAFDIGQDGTFDDNGVILGSIVYDGEKWRMYYVGFQKVLKAKFYAFTGVAESKDLLIFERKFQTPIIDRKDWMKFIGAIHTVIKEDDKYKVWYVAGNGWEKIAGKEYPQYSVYYTESQDGYKLDYAINHHIVPATSKEYRIGRPVVYKLPDKYIMFCTYDTLEKQYGIAYFESKNGINWERMDDKLQGLEKSESGWDSEMTCYPTLLNYKDKTYCFYNGNNMGATGFGYAELIK